MGRSKGGKNRYWSKDKKLRIIKKVVDDGISSEQVAREEGISAGMLRNWVKKYLQDGIESLENKKKPGNPLSKYANRKELNEIEQLEYENMKLRIENERLKKGYMMKGDGTFVIYKR
jgi:transposase-like protein